MVLITKNEAGSLRRCLESVRWADEVVVLDSGSEDGTVAIAREFGARVSVRPFTDYADQRNAALADARGVWVLSLDPDEEVSPELRAEIGSRLPGAREAGFWVPHQNFLLGRWIRHGGWYPSWHLRLFRREGARWVGEVHEKVVVTGPVGWFRVPIVHRPPKSRTVRGSLEGINRYTDLEADAMAPQPWWRLLVQMVLRPPAMFAYKYVWQQGFRDGVAGLVIAVMFAYYEFARAAKTWERQTRRTS